MVIILSLKRFKGPIANLLATIFFGIVVWMLSNFRQKDFLVVMVCIYLVLSLKSYPIFRVLFYF